MARAPAQIAVVDCTSGGWGHVLVDDVAEWRVPPGALAGPRSP